MKSNPKFDYEVLEKQGIDEPHWMKTSWKDLQVGDFVKILDNKSIPADILICATSEEKGSIIFIVFIVR